MSTATHPPETPTPASRYPARLSRNHKSAGQLRQQAGNSGRNNHRGKGRNKRNQYPAPSIDHHSRPIPNRPAPSTNPVIRIKELSSLEELLQQAGYKDTRVYTPEAEKVRQIKKTFDEDEAEELNDLYGTFGLTRGPALGSIREHRIQNVTEPTIPFRSSSAVLRDLALQDMKLNERDVASSSPTEPSSWWEGGMAAIGRAAKAVIESSPPPKVDMSCPDTDATADHGLAVRKAKSNIELSSGTRFLAEAHPQEQRPPAHADTMDHSDESLRKLASTTTKLLREGVVNTFDLPPPPALDDEAFGYRPLPDGYEAQSDEDTGVFDSHSFDLESFEYSDGQQAAVDDDEDSKEAQAVETHLDLFTSAGSASSYEVDYDLGRRVMADAREYDDELDSPPASLIALPDVDNEGETMAGPSATPLANHLASETPQPTRKYADRATKLRIAKSTPALSCEPTETGWFDSIRQALVGSSQGNTPVTAVHPVSTMQNGPLRITPSTIAAPSLVTKSSVVCDSASDGAIDLPPVATRRHEPTGIVSSIPLRLRPSIARLKQAVFATPVIATEDTTPTLSPRMDWDSQGEHYAGWNWSTKKQRPSASSVPSSPPALADVSQRSGGLVKGSIDYTKSFFYKPATPPRKPTSDGARPAIETSHPEPQIRARRSIKSLKAALALPFAAPPVPAIPPQFSLFGSQGSRTPPRRSSELRLDPPVLAIQSPGSWEAGLPPRALVLEGEEWDARDGSVPGDWGRKASRKTGARKLKKTSTNVDR